MAGKPLPIYRLPMQPRQRVGQLLVKKDRNGKLYIEGTRVEEMTPAGEYQILSMPNGKKYYVLQSDLDQL